MAPTPDLHRVGHGQVTAHQEGVAARVGRLVDDARAVASAEVELHKARLAERVAAYRNAAIFFAAAGVLALAALIALLVGLIMTLSTVVHPGLATAIVVAGVLVIAGVLAWVGRSRLAPPDVAVAQPAPAA